MLSIAWYILKVIICSGILLGYYWLFLRNKIFHSYNRFYLLAAIILALSVPLIQINIWNKGDQSKSEVIRLLQVVTNGDDYVDRLTATPPTPQLDATTLMTIIYLTGSAIFLILFIHVLWTIRTLLRKYQRRLVDNIYFVNTDARGTPFSFLRYIFWNEKIDIESPAGNQIFRHEVAHIQEKHSHDKIFLNIIMIFFWCNPFFWIIRKELNMIHEFIADKKAVEDSDTAAFAAMILATAYPRHRFQLTNNFFYSPIKRRLLMLTKNQNPKVNYIGRVLVLPLTVLIFAAFTFKAKVHTPVYNGKTITVVIDAGHGGIDAGAISSDGKVSEKDINLAIVKKIKEVNSNDKISIILTRNDDTYQSPSEKVAFSKRQNADLFISFHVDNGPNATANTKTGMSVWVPNDESTNAAKSKVLASTIINTFNKNYGLSVMEPAVQRSQKIMVLRDNTCPAVLIETGFINNEKDLAYLQTESAKRTIAQNILQAIEAYAASQSLGVVVNGAPYQASVGNTDSIPSLTKSKQEHDKEISEIKQIAKGKEEIAYVYKGRSYFFMTGNTDNFWETELNAPVLVNGKIFYSPEEINAVVKRSDVVDITRIEKEDAVAQFGINKTVLRISKANEKTADLASSASIPGDALYILDGREITAAKGKTLPPGEIYSINVLKGKAAVKKYGDKGINGVVEIESKKNGNNAVAASPLYILDGKETEKSVIQKINATDIKEMNVLKDVEATKAYGNKGKNGVIIINTKSRIDAKVNIQSQADIKTASTIDAKVDLSPRISFGEITRSRADVELFKKQQEIRITPGYTFVEADIYFSGAGFKNVELVHLRNSSLEPIETRMQRCEPGTAITFDNIRVKDPEGTVRVIDGIAYILIDPNTKTTDDKVFTAVETEPKFPGTPADWVEYLNKHLDWSIPLSEGWEGKYKVMLQFIVHKDGSVSDVKALNYEKSKTAKNCIDLIAKGPKWDPALQNGRPVDAYMKQPITLLLEKQN